MATVGDVRVALAALNAWMKELPAGMLLHAGQQAFVLSVLRGQGKLDGLGVSADARGLQLDDAPLAMALRDAVGRATSVFASSASSARITDEDMALLREHLAVVLQARWPTQEDVEAAVRVVPRGNRVGRPDRAPGSFPPLPAGTEGAPADVRAAIALGDIAGVAKALLTAVGAVEPAEGKASVWAAVLRALMATSGPRGFRFVPQLLVDEARSSTRDVQAAARLGDALVDGLTKALSQWTGALDGAGAAALVDAMEAAPRRLLDIAAWPRVQISVVRRALSSRWQANVAMDLDVLVDGPLADAHATLIEGGAPTELAAAFSAAAEAHLLWRLSQWDEAAEVAAHHRQGQLATLRLGVNESLAALVARAQRVWRAVRGGQAMLATDLLPMVGTFRGVVEPHLERALEVRAALVVKDQRDKSYDAHGSRTTACAHALRSWWRIEAAPTLEGLAQRAALRTFVAIFDEALRRHRASMPPPTHVGSATRVAPPASRSPSPRGRSPSPDQKRAPVGKKSGKKGRRSSSPAPMGPCYGCGVDGHSVWRCPLIQDEKARQAIADARRAARGQGKG